MFIGALIKINFSQMLITGVEEEPACALSDSCSGDIGEGGSDWLGEFDFDYKICYMFYFASSYILSYTG